MTARTRFEVGALSPLVAMTRGVLWQRPADFDRLSPLHALRHTATTNVYRASKDPFLAQGFAPPASPLTAVVDTHPSDEELYEGVRDLRC